MLPSGENATELTEYECPVRMVFTCPETTSHKRISSQLALARVVPSGENATELTEDVCPVSACFACPETTSHTCTVTPLSL